MRARNLKPGFFKNELLASCSWLAQKLFQGLWCLADREGRLEDRVDRIKAEVLPYDSCDANALLDELQLKGFILRYIVRGAAFICLPTFSDHQRPHPKEPESKLPPPKPRMLAAFRKRFAVEKNGESRLLSHSPFPIAAAAPIPAAAAAAAKRSKKKPSAETDLPAEAGGRRADAVRRGSNAARRGCPPEFLPEFVKRGLSAQLAEAACSTAEPSLLRLILGYFDARKNGLKNPSGALRSMLEDPRRWGFELSTDGTWTPPADGKAAPRVETPEDIARRQQERMKDA